MSRNTAKQNPYNIVKTVLASARARGFLKQNYILILSKDTNAPLEVHSYKSLPEATIKYFEFESNHINHPDIDIVLVRAPSEENLRVSYKNYFSDTQDFVRLVKEGMQILENT